MAVINTLGSQPGVHNRCLCKNPTAAQFEYSGYAIETLVAHFALVLIHEV